MLAAIIGMFTAAPAPAAVVTCAYDSAAYTYDAPALLSSPDTAGTDARGSPSGPSTTSGGSAVSVARDGVAAETASRVGWSVGDDIYSATRAGSAPSWSTVRARFWKNEAANSHYGTWTDEQLARMSTGRAPQRFNPDKGGIESMELSHEPEPPRVPWRLSTHGG